ncbi:MAG: hypothetical protein WC650_05915 [Candidatus Doudnabacteria bacterium]
MINLAYVSQLKMPKQKISKKRFWLFLTAFILVLGAGCVAGYFLLLKHKTSFTGQAVKLDIIAPHEVISGSTYDYLVEYANEEGENLENAKLTIYFPSGFNFLDALPSPEGREELQEANVVKKVQGESRALTWNLGLIAKGNKAAVKLKGAILGEVGAKRALKAIISYQPENFNSRFSKEKEIEVKIKQSLVDFSLEASSRVGKGKEFNILVKYRNATAEDLENLRIIVNYPIGFSFTASQPRSDHENNTWDLRVLEPGERGRIDIQGKIPEVSPQGLVFRANLGILDQYQQFFSQISEERPVIVLDPRLEITATVNKEEKTTLRPGEELEFIITYYNVSEVSLEGTSITYKMNTDLLDPDSIAVENGRRDAGGNFVWDDQSEPNLKKISPNQKGKVKFTARLLSVFPYSSLDKRNLKLTGKASFISNKVGDLEGFNFNVESNDLEAKINTEFSLAEEARYYTLEYEKAGSGPLPPKVGESTTYRVYWTVSNTTNDAENIRLQTTLPEGVGFGEDSFTSLGNNIKYNSETREVLWDLGRLQAYAGSVLSGAQAWFEVVITPNTVQLGQILPLTGETKISGRDLFTEEEISGSYPALDTDLKNDLGAIGKGKVEK